MYTLIVSDEEVELLVDLIDNETEGCDDVLEDLLKNDYDSPEMLTYFTSPTVQLKHELGVLRAKLLPQYRRSTVS